MKSLKTEFKEQLFFQEKHVASIFIVAIITMMIPLAISDLFFTESLSDSVKYSASLDDMYLLAVVLGILVTITEFAVVFISFVFACAARFGIDPYSKIKQFFDIWKIYSHFKKQFTADEISNATSKLPKNSNNTAKELAKKLVISEQKRKQSDKENSKLRKKIKEFEDDSDKDK